MKTLTLLMTNLKQEKTMSDFNHHANNNLKKNGASIQRGWQYDEAPIKPTKDIECPVFIAQAKLDFYANGGYVKPIAFQKSDQFFTVQDVNDDVDEFLSS